MARTSEERTGLMPVPSLGKGDKLSYWFFDLVYYVQCVTHRDELESERARKRLREFVHRANPYTIDDDDR
jgi:hypothetical protein